MPYLSNKRLNPRQRRLLRVAQAQLGLSEAEYEGLKERFGVKSSKDLTQDQFTELMAHLQRCGFQYAPDVKKAPEIGRQQRAKQVYLGAIETALNALGLPWSYAEGIAWQMFGIRKLEWLSPDQAHKVQVALIYHQGRQDHRPEAGAT